jgi:hypothetical protein
LPDEQAGLVTKGERIVLGEITTTSTNSEKEVRPVQESRDLDHEREFLKAYGILKGERRTSKESQKIS